MFYSAVQIESVLFRLASQIKIDLASLTVDFHRIGCLHDDGGEFPDDMHTNSGVSSRELTAGESTAPMSAFR